MSRTQKIARAVAPTVLVILAFIIVGLITAFANSI